MDTACSLMLARGYPRQVLAALYSVGAVVICRRWQDSARALVDKKSKGEIARVGGGELYHTYQTFLSGVPEV